MYRDEGEPYNDPFWGPHKIKLVSELRRQCPDVTLFSKKLANNRPVVEVTNKGRGWGGGVIFTLLKYVRRDIRDLAAAYF